MTRFRHVIVGSMLGMGMALAASRFQGSNPSHVIVDEVGLRPSLPRLPLSPAEQDGAGLRPNRKSRRRTASLIR